MQVYFDSASKHAGEFGPVKHEVQLRDHLTWVGKGLCPGKSGPI